MTAIPQTAFGRGRTLSEGAKDGNVRFDVTLTQINEKWPNLPTGTPSQTQGGMMTLSVFGAKPYGSEGWYEADPKADGVTSQVEIEAAGAVIFPPTDVHVFYKLDGNGKLVSIAGEANDAAGRAFSILTTAHTIDASGASSLAIALVRSGSLQFSTQRHAA